MGGHRMEFACDLEFSPMVVWDALVDADLVAGWLADAEIEARVGGRYDLLWHAPFGLGRTNGEVADLVEGESLVVELERLGVVTFSLARLADGGTRLVLALDGQVEQRLSAGLRATLLVSLEQLDDLLRGRSVDWERWDEERGPSWIAHRENEARRVR